MYDTCPNCAKTTRMEPARPGERTVYVHVDTGREDC